MFKLGKWNFRCSLTQDFAYRTRGWYQFDIGVFKPHYLPGDGTVIHRNDYIGFYWKFDIFLPVIFQRNPLRKMPNKQPPKTLIWAGDYRRAKDFIAEHGIADAKIILSPEQLRGYRDATLIDLGNHPANDATDRMRKGIEDSLICDRLNHFTEQEYLNRKAQLNNWDQPPNYGLTKKPLY